MPTREAMQDALGRGASRGGAMSRDVPCSFRRNEREGPASAPEAGQQPRS